MGALVDHGAFEAVDLVGRRSARLGVTVLPYDVPANQFLTIKGSKQSTSKRMAVWVPDYLERFPPDPLRYHLAANMPEESLARMRRARSSGSRDRRG